jgi:DNA polymerase-3 subunit gamma/tau
MLQGDGLGVDLAAVGRETGTVTLLAMLQIIDHALGRMRSSGHAAVLAEIAIVRLASLDDLDSLADAVERLGSEPSGTAAPAVRPAPAARPAEPVREKKTADLAVGGKSHPGPFSTKSTAENAEGFLGRQPPLPAADDVLHGLLAQPAPITGRPEPVAVDREDALGAVEAARSASVAASLPVDPLDAWRRGAETVGGLAADFAELASRAVWRDDMLEVTLPGSAGNAASFLRRPEIAAGLTRALAELAGRPVRHSLVIDSAPEPAVGDAESEGRRSGAAERGRAAVSQSAMLREAAEHPLVVHVRTLFDAAVRKVEPPRPRPVAAVATPAAQTVDPSAGAAVAHDDERDHAAADDLESGEDYGGIDG